MVWYGMVWYGMVWYGMVWYGMVWYGMVWYGMVWYGMIFKAECTVNEKFCILHEAAGAECSLENFEFIVHSASACICKQNTNLTVSNTFNICEFTTLARKQKQKPYTFAHKTK